MIMLAGAGPWWDNPTFWVGVAFFILVGFAIKQGVVGAITKALDDRAAAIRAELDEAKRLKQDAQALLEDYKKKHAAAEAEAQSIIDNARREAETLAAEARRQLKETVERRTKQAEDKIARAEAQAVSEVRSASVDLAIAAAEKVLAGKSADAGGSLIDQTIRDLKGKLN